MMWINGMHILEGGPTHRIIDQIGRDWFFEMHNYCGPVVLKKDGDPATKQPPESSSFWIAVSLWAQQGKKVNKDNYCEYEAD